jgi:cobalt-zinc-cadmium efflux system membrane fusion protein
MKTLSLQQRLLAGAAAAVILLGGGFAVWTLTRSPEAAPETQAAEEEAHGAGEALEMDAARIQASGIVLAPVGSGSLSAEIVAQGTVVGTPQGEAVLAARADGVISRVTLRLGDSVRAGQTVALIESREASTIAAERAAAQARLTAARLAFAREQRLFDAQITARQDLESAQTALAEAEAESRRTSSAAAAARVSTDGRSTGVVSPISGRVTAANATLGSFVSAGTELFRVANARLIEVQASVSAEDAGRIAPGDGASINLREGDVQATVRSITPGVNAESRAATVILSLSSVGGLRPGQAVSVRLYSRDAPVAGGISVPEEAIQTVEGREVVFVRTAAGFSAAPVIVGQRSAGRAQIISGLRAGQIIANRNAFQLKAALGAGEVEH